MRVVDFTYTLCTYDSHSVVSLLTVFTGQMVMGYFLWVSWECTVCKTR